MSIRRLLLLATAAVCACGGDTGVGPGSTDKPQPLASLAGTTIRLSSVNGGSLPALYDTYGGAWADSATMTFQADSVLAFRTWFGLSNSTRTARAPGQSQFVLTRAAYSVANGVVLVSYPTGGVPDTLIAVNGGFDAHLNHDPVPSAAPHGVWRFATVWNGPALNPVPTLSSYVMQPPAGDLYQLARAMPFVYGTILINGSGFTSATNFPNGNYPYIPGVQAPLRVAQFAANQLRLDNVPVTWFFPGARNQITVANPGPGGGSATIVFVADNPAPIVTSVSPTTSTVLAQGVRITVTGANFTNATTVLWNGAPIQTMFTSPSQVIGFPADSNLAQPGTVQVSVRTPAPGGGTSPATPFTLTGVALQLTSHTVSAVTLSARYMVADPARPLVYVGTDNYDATYPNSVVAIDVASGAVAWSLPIGGNVNAMAVSDHGEFLYVGGMQLSQVVRISLAAHVADMQIRLGGDSAGLFRARYLAVAPGSPRTLAVDPGRLGTPAIPSQGVLIFDDSTQRPVIPTIGPVKQATLVAFGTSAAVLYGFDETALVFVMDVSPAGVSIRTQRGVPGLSASHQMLAIGGRLFFADGSVVDPAAYAQASVLSGYQSGYVTGQNPLAASSDGTSIYAVYNNHLLAWDTQQLGQTAAVALPAQQYPAQYVVRWGADGIAYLQNGQVHFVRAAFVH